MIEKALIVKSQDQTATLKRLKAPACLACGARSGCRVKESYFKARNLTGQELRAGNLVDVFLPPKQTVAGVFVVLIVPLVMFLLFFKLTEAALPTSVEGIRVLAGLVGLGFGFLIALAYGRLAGKKHLPHIVKQHSH